MCERAVPAGGDHNDLLVKPVYFCQLHDRLTSWLRLPPDKPRLSADKIGTDGANTFPSTIKSAVDDGLCIRSRFIVSPSIFSNASRAITFEAQDCASNNCRVEAMQWLRKGFGFSGDWTVNDQNDLIAPLVGLPKVDKA